MMLTNSQSGNESALGLSGKIFYVTKLCLYSSYRSNVNLTFYFRAA